MLYKSYRCPRSTLMLAYALGRGIYRPKGSIQMLSKLSSWRRGTDGENHVRNFKWVRATSWLATVSHTRRAVASYNFAP